MRCLCYDHTEIFTRIWIVEEKIKALVTGGAGFIGSNLVDELINMGWEVIVIDNESAQCNDNFYWNPLAKNYLLDVADYSRTRLLYDNVDCVFHLAAESRMQPSINNPINAIKTNVVGTSVALECSRQSNVKKFIYSSTSSAYGNNSLPNQEFQGNDCLNVYSLSKTFGEDLCKIYSKTYDMNILSLRYFNVYGERQPTKGEYATVIGLFLKQYSKLTPLTIVGNGLQKRDFTHVSDIVSANIMAALTSEIISFKGEVYNIGSGKNYSILDIANMISNNIEYIPERIGEAFETLSDTTKAKISFGWEPKVSINEWINKNK